MARHPLRDCWAIELPVLLLLLLRPPQTPGTTCSTPTSIEHANIQVKSYNENSRERYICNSGFKRKAGTSSLTKCLRNEDTNITQWTIPTLICIRDPSLTRQRPSSTVAPAGVTPEPESPSPSGKGTTGIVRNELSQAPPQTTAKALEHTPSTSLEKPGAHSSSSTAVTVATISTPVLCGACVVLLLVCYHKKSRQTSQTPSDQVENMEDIPMTGGNNGREEDTENYHTV
ncbi:interleukin-15 receptor subunit alpha isoform X4 [Myotis daubentonii]|uniref:interleukin-15 receptor subunit alpha isoform X4 n=1 Tax=Myotis daubentonii TaxID=98922 RepID=UPI002873277E|nr:interleukin-15 receptor subunit alpha isoform X4 [Myotis daubentonii]